jgi:hypothetical protein
MDSSNRADTSYCPFQTLLPPATVFEQQLFELQKISGTTCLALEMGNGLALGDVPASDPTGGVNLGARHG